MKIAALYLSIAAVAAPQQDDGLRQNVFQSIDQPRGAGTDDKRTTLFVDSFEHGVRYEAAHLSPADVDMLTQIFDRYQTQFRAIEFKFDAAGARFNPETSTVDFPICSANIDNLTYVAARKCDETVSRGSVESSINLSMALGIAEFFGGSTDEAVRLLSKAIDSGELRPEFRPTAYRFRAEVNKTISFESEVGSEAADRASMSIITDCDRVIALEPEEVECRFAEASAWGYLGDYPTAEKRYAALAVKLPDEKFRTVIGHAAILRLRGEYELALEMLNSLVPEFRDSLGMKFHYHRGWTLMHLGRFDEAIADFSEGLKVQPDYPWAYLRRACAYAQTGELQLAEEDFAVGVRFMKQYEAAKSSASTQREISIAEQAMTAAKAARPDDVVSLCRQSSVWEKRREKPSALLDAKLASQLSS